MLAFTSCGGDKPPVNVYTINLTQSASALDQTNNACNIDAKIFLDGNLVEDKVDWSYSFPTTVPSGLLTFVKIDNRLSIELTKDIATSQFNISVVASYHEKKATTKVLVNEHQPWQNNWIPISMLNINSSSGVLNGYVLGSDLSSYDTLMIPSKVKSIAPNAFDGDAANKKLPSNITKLDFYENSLCTSIGKESFYKNTLSEVVIGNTVTTINEAAFAFSSAMTSLTLGDKLVAIGKSAFVNCIEITNTISIPSSVTSIGEDAFRTCLKIPSFIFSNSAKLQTLGTNCFSECTGVEILELPNSVRSIGYGALGSMSKLRECRLGNYSNLFVDQVAFAADRALTLLIIEKPTILVYSTMLLYDTPLLTTNSGQIKVPASLLTQYKTSWTDVPDVNFAAI